MAQAAPLAGLVVIDLSRVLAGPFATMMLADLGARVIKIERRDRGDDSRGYGPFVAGQSLYFARVNRGKESIALDLRDADDRHIFERMVARADVVVENFRPGVMDRLGYGYDVLCALRPGLIYASISGFGQTGPWRMRPAYDSVVQGTSGLLSVTGAPDAAPTKPGMPIGDLSAGLYAFGAILAAVHGRDAERGQPPRGARLDIAMHDSTVSVLEGAALAYLATGEQPPRIGNAHYAIAPFDTFQAADRLFIICAANDGLFGSLCRAVGRAELAEDPRFLTNTRRHEHREALKTELEIALAERTADEWLQVLEAAGVPCGPVATVAEALTSEQAAARQLVIDVGGMRMPGNPIKLGGYPDLLPTPAPTLDQHGTALRAEFGA